MPHFILDWSRCNLYVKIKIQGVKAKRKTLLEKRTIYLAGNYTEAGVSNYNRQINAIDQELYELYKPFMLS